MKSHVQFIKAYCLYDDLKNIEDGMDSARFNWVFHLLAKELEFKHEHMKINELKKYLYIRNIAQDVLIDALEALNEASEILGLSKKTLWKETVNEIRNELEYYLQVIHDYISTLKEMISSTQIPKEATIQ